MHTLTHTHTHTQTDPGGSPHLSLLVADAPVELLAVDAQEVLPRVDDATLDGDGPGRVDVVPGHHAHRDARVLALHDGVGHLGSRHNTEQRLTQRPRNICVVSCFLIQTFIVKVLDIELCKL